MRVFVAAFAAMLLPACVTVNATDVTARVNVQPSDLEAMAIVQARNTYYEQLVAEQDVDGLIALHTEDYAIFRPGKANVEGAEAHRRYWETAFETMDGLSIDEKTVFFAGPDTIISHDFYQTFSDGDQIGGGQSVIVWKKIDGGVWLVHWEMFN
ncbi:MAG: nuclear transport factor 2 family protein [Henriciella sp.]|nr:nuclear transport factor 2 family protein [Henriciella sp.]